MVHAVQVASKHFDHSPELLEEAHALLVSTGCDNAHGLTTLLRKHDAPAPIPARAAQYA